MKLRMWVGARLQGQEFTSCLWGELPSPAAGGQLGSLKVLGCILFSFL